MNFPNSTAGGADAQGSRPAGVGTLTQNDIDVIRERRFGWERASPKLLAAVFGVSVQRINAVCNHPHIFKPIQ